MRRAVRRLGLPAVALLAAACSGSASSSPPAASATGPTTTATAFGHTAAAATTVPAPGEKFEIQAFDVAAAEGAPESFQGVRAQLEEALDHYLEQAVLTPLRSGLPAGDLSALFAGPAAERIAGPDRAALVDEGLPKLTDVALEKATAAVAILAGAGGEVGLASARISVVVKGAISGMPLVVEHTGELFFGRDGDAWKISGYQVRVSKDTLEGSATTAA